VALSLARPLGSVLVALSAAVVVIAAGIAVFLNPVWVGFEQARTHADLFTGYTMDAVHRVSGEILVELVLGPGTFLQSVAGVTVLAARERQHMADVRAVLLGFLGLVGIAIVVLAVAGWRARDRAWLWRSIAGGTAVLAGAVVVAGALFAVFFDAAFELFHRLFFAGGSYTFDPTQERLVQLFPEAFWSETSVALAIVILLVALAVTWAAVRRAGPRLATNVRAEPAREPSR